MYRNVNALESSAEISHYEARPQAREHETRRKNFLKHPHAVATTPSSVKLRSATLVGGQSPHVGGLDVRAAPMGCAYVVRAARVERDAQQQREREAAGPSAEVPAEMKVSRREREEGPRPG